MEAQIQFGLYTAAFVVLVRALLTLEKKKTTGDGSQDWGHGLNPSRDNPGGGDPIIPKNDPTDPNKSQDPVWQTTVDPFPTTPFCAINLGFRHPYEPTTGPGAGTLTGYPPIISWAPEMSNYNQGMCLGNDGSAASAAAQVYTGFKGQSNFDKNPSLNGAQVVWYDPVKFECSTSTNTGQVIRGPCKSWMQVPVGTPNEWKQWGAGSDF